MNSIIIFLVLTLYYGTHGIRSRVTHDLPPTGSSTSRKFTPILSKMARRPNKQQSESDTIFCAFLIPLVYLQRKKKGKKELYDRIVRMIHPRIELGPKAWQASIITTRLMNLEFDKGGVNIIAI